MAMDHNQQGRRPHYHRGRRGTDRRGNERRSQQAPEPQTARPSGDQTDVEQIMREIRARISQRHGIDLSPQQIQDLAARRLESILDPRTVNPTLFDQLRKGAAATPDPLPAATNAEYSFSDDAIYEGGAAVRFFRRLFHPLLKLLFNPAPLVAALQAQVRINRDAAARAAELERRQSEWNALHYQILQRLVTEVSRASIETQALASRIESLAGRVDFNDKRVRTLENAPTPAPAPAPAPARPQRQPETATPAAAAAPESAPSADTASASPAATGDAPRRRRRRRRGRRGAMLGTESAANINGPATAAGAVADTEEEDDGDLLDTPESTEPSLEVDRSEPSPVTGPMELSPAVDSLAFSPAVDQSEPPTSSIAPEPTVSPFAGDQSVTPYVQHASAAPEPEQAQQQPDSIPSAPVDLPDPDRAD
jgi:hypothetical protein